MRFLGAKTIEKAEAAVRKRFPAIKHCDLSGCEPSLVNRVLVRLFGLIELYPGPAELIERIVACDLADSSIPEAVGGKVPFAHTCATYDRSQRCLYLDRKSLAHNELTPEEEEELVRDTPRVGSDWAYPAVHAFAHIVLDWLGDSDAQITVFGCTGRPVDVLNRFMVPHPFDEYISTDALLSNEEMIAEVFACDHLEGSWEHNAERIMTLLKMITAEANRASSIAEQDQHG